jgi:membrane-associated phospholipid phosphatase
MLAGLILLKYIPMTIWGQDILFDASAHITAAIFILYLGWYLIDHNPNWQVYYFVFSAAIVIIVAFQRIISNAHNDIGVMLGILLSLASIALSRWKYFHGRIGF